MPVFIAGGGAVPDVVNHLNYIQSSGTQYIDTGVLPTQSVKVVIDAEFLQQSSGNYDLFGARTSGSGPFFFMRARFGQPDFAVRIASAAVVSVPNTSNVADRYSFVLQSGLASVGGNSIAVSTNAFSISKSIFIGALNTESGPLNYATAKVYSCQIYDNGTLILDYWPAIDPSGVVCMYDKVNKEYAYNAGAGEFIGG